MSKDLQLSIRVNGNQAAADVRRFTSSASGDMRRFTDSAGRGLGSLSRQTKQLWRDFNGFSTASKLFVAAGGFLGAKNILQDSANLDKNLIRIKQTAGLTAAEMTTLRKEVFAMAQETGASHNDLAQGLDSAVQSGLSFRSVLPVLGAVNKAVAVTGANTNTLVGGLTVASAAFNFDLSKPEMATLLLDKMTVAGRLGNAELENLSDIFARVGVNANSAGLGFDKTLAFIEALSQVEKNPERLSTLADSTLRVFTNRNYSKAAQKATGIQFFDKKGGARDPVAVLQDIKKQYDKLKTDAQRSRFIDAAFGKADLDTIKGIKTLLSGSGLSDIGRFSDSISQATGTVARDLPEALHNAIDQTARLREAMSKAGDAFAKPVNEVLTTYASKLADDENARSQLLKGVAATGTAALLLRFNNNRKTRLASEAAEKADKLERAASAARTQNVFVTNWPASMPGDNGAANDEAFTLSKDNGVSKKPNRRNKANGKKTVRSEMPSNAVQNQRVFVTNWPTAMPGGKTNNTSVANNPTADVSNDEPAKSSKLGKAGKALGAVGAAMSGWEMGQAIGGVAKELIDSTIQAVTGQESATLGTAIYDMLHRSKIDTGGELHIKIDQDGQAKVTSMKTNDPRMNMNVDAGLTMSGAR